MSIDVNREVNESHKTLSLTLAVPPSVNKLYTMRKRLTVHARSFIDASVPLIKQSIYEQKWIVPAKHNWLYVDCVFYFPDRRIRDASNCLKILLDVMQGHVYVNDYVCLPRIWSVEYDKDNPRVEIKVSHQSDMQRTKGIHICG